MKVREKQLELNLGRQARCRSVNLRARRRAGWWFERIRAAMDSGVEGAGETPRAGERGEVATQRSRNQKGN